MRTLLIALILIALPSMATAQTYTTCPVHGQVIVSPPAPVVVGPTVIEQRQGLFPLLCPRKTTTIIYPPTYVYPTPRPYYYGPYYYGPYYYGPYWR